MDMDEVGGLLTIVERASGHSGKFSAIVGEAMTRLLEINEECRKAGLARAEEARVAEAERMAEEQERLAAEEEERKTAEDEANEAARKVAVTPRSIPRTQIEKTNGEPTRRI